jgi:anti-sigma B factor antagonist
VKNTKKKAGGTGTSFPIKGEMTIYQASELKPVLLDALNKSKVLEIDLSGVTEIDTAGVQLLMMMKKTAQEWQHEMHLTGHSPSVLEIFELANLASYFGDQLVIQSPSKSNSANT